MAATVPFPGEDQKAQPKLIKFDGFTNLNTQAGRSAIGDQEFSWCENMMPIGAGNMRSVWSKGADIYTAPVGTSILSHFAFNIGTSRYIAVFLSDGRADQVNIDTNAVTPISATPGTFAPGSFPYAVQFGNSGILIVSSAFANGYWAWDGTLYSPGGASPTWLNGGTPTTMPTGLTGNAVEVYQSRVWIVNGSTCTYSAPSNGAQFGSGGAGSFTSTDAFLRHQFVGIKQSSGFLYLFGDSSINVISNVQTSGSPAITTFSNTNIDPQISTPYPRSIQAFGRWLLFVNTSGVWGLFGGAVEKVSEPLDGIFNTALFAGGIPIQSAVATIFGIKCYLFLITILDPVNSAYRNMIVAWTGKKWFVCSQEAGGLSRLCEQEFDSELAAWGVNIGSTSTLFKLFQAPSTTLPKVVRSKLWSGDAYTIFKQVLRIYAQAFDNTTVGSIININIDTENGSVTTPISLVATIAFTNNLGQLIQFQNSLAQNLFFTVAGLAITGSDCNASGLLIGMTITSTGADFTLVSAAMLYRDRSPYGG